MNTDGNRAIENQFFIRKAIYEIIKFFTDQVPTMAHRQVAHHLTMARLQAGNDSIYSKMNKETNSL